MNTINNTNHPDSVELATELSKSQYERLAYIDFCLYFLGQIGRQSLQERFEIASAAATRDFATYKKIWPKNSILDGKSKMYVPSSDFTPAFDHVYERVMTMLSMGFGGSVGTESSPLLPCEMPVAMNRPSLSIVASISRAINQKKPVKICYSSQNGDSEREIIPFAFATDGLRWHTRVYDRNRECFTDFVLSRMKSAEIMNDSQVAKYEMSSEDNEWNRVVELELKPHPNRSDAEKKMTALDFGMVDGGFKVKIRAAMAGYVLRQWHVDCSEDCHITDKAFRLCLSDPLVLYGVESAKLAPEYQPPKKSTN